MCDTCGCGDPHLIPVEIHETILEGNNQTAAHNRAHFAAAGVTAVNLMGSPGAGKTAVLEATARRRAGQRLGAIAGDLATERDAERLRAAGVAAASITTGSACHLDAAMVHRALHHFPWRDLDYLFIENVGNLVCPAIYDLGQAANVVALSVTEGEDKPLKYPVMFRAADLVLITKIDLLPHLSGVSVAAIAAHLDRVMPQPAFLALSAETGDGMDAWLAWLDARRTAVRAASTAPARHLHAPAVHAHGDLHHDTHAPAHRHAPTTAPG
jgi:hydrogenase nickel incorporation protein HypB